MDFSAEQTLKLLKSGGYQAPSGNAVDIAAWQQAALDGTRLYTPEIVDSLVAEASEGDIPHIRIADSTTQVAALQMAEGGIEDVALLNFASATRPGGGFLRGTRTQEEDLCRCSGLYPCLLTQPAYYEANKSHRSLLYTDHIIFSPAVPFFRVSDRVPFLEEPFRASVITAPAPNTTPILERNPRAGVAIADTFYRRWGGILAIARDNGQRNIILGAWGCGVFGGDPAVASKAVLYWLIDTHFGGSFDRVVFAIPNQSEQSKKNFTAFQKAIERA